MTILLSLKKWKQQLEPTALSPDLDPSPTRVPAFSPQLTRQQRSGAILPPASPLTPLPQPKPNQVLEAALYAHPEMFPLCYRLILVSSGERKKAQVFMTA